MLKASWGGGGRGMRAIRAEADLLREVTEGKREAKAAFGKDEVYLEKLVERARHVEVQVLGDTHGNAVHLFERDCSIQRRNQKVVERAPAPYLSQALREELCGYALKIARDTSYIGAGTVEFLQDADTGKFYFIEVNPRIQVEHTVTEQVTGIDIVKAQIHILDGFAIGTPESACRRRRTSASTATRCSAASPRKTRNRISFPTMAASPPIAARPASASASTAAPPIPARSSPASTIRCWKR
jgi:pyruvate carboxylase